MSDSAGGSWDDDDDDQRHADETSVFEAFAVYVSDDADTAGILDELGSNTDDDLLTVVFTATNPQGTVSVTALLDGRVLRVDLDPKVSSMTEIELAQEIVAIARLATRQALAGQHLVIAALMQRRGHDSVNTRSFLERELRLPPPDVVVAERAQLFAHRYAAKEEWRRQ
ncbi:YbaB/EbfC family nucleoid-associated protein [Mycolicibacterium fluoranthenivorans]|uniref:DNA-binding protein YbaB n=1 Tax=Mycolicibacterium fluoranthenivorans TaxID=258505 RepID=A0A7X5R4G5_9MYCO|nr:YbaB/EbfC family nucleoid-associated protein [Mycolicibacterium fluoranthenivorans]MCV7355542.1 YbaB/EbfC family nucleoid-associated protein [Mycolicibacterium fluoranthenivorans]NIH93095.1 DNA-binding protein YbaB [Mycolicibacterium fluoranthenivorans]